MAFAISRDLIDDFGRIVQIGQQIGIVPGGPGGGVGGSTTLPPIPPFVPPDPFGTGAGVRVDGGCGCGRGSVCAGTCSTGIFGTSTCSLCVPATEVGVQTPIGSGQGVFPQGTGNGACSCTPRKCPSKTTCELPNGRSGKTNRSRYYRFGDCRRGTGPGVVEANTVCVASRRTNFGNVGAGKKAARRLNGMVRVLTSAIDTVDNIAKAKKRKPKR